MTAPTRLETLNAPETFKRRVLYERNHENIKAIVVTFIGQTHQLSEAILAVLSELAEEHHPSVRCVRVDVDESEASKVLRLSGVNAVPCLKVYRYDDSLDMFVSRWSVETADIPTIVSIVEGVATGTFFEKAKKISQSEHLEELLSTYPIVVFLEGTRACPKTQASEVAVKLLSQTPVPFEWFDVSQDKDVAAELPHLGGLKDTFPQLWIQGVFIAGGAADIMTFLSEPETAAILQKVWGPEKQTLADKLRQLLQSKPIMVFMKGTPQAPFCKFSKQLMAVFQMAGISEFGFFNIFEDDTVRENLKKLSSWPTYPQVYAGGQLMGGVDVLRTLVASGGPEHLIETFEEQKKAQNRMYNRHACD